MIAREKVRMQRAERSEGGKEGESEGEKKAR